MPDYSASRRRSLADSGPALTLAHPSSLPSRTRRPQALQMHRRGLLQCHPQYVVLPLPAFCRPRHRSPLTPACSDLPAAPRAPPQRRSRRTSSRPSSSARRPSTRAGRRSASTTCSRTRTSSPSSASRRARVEEGRREGGRTASVRLAVRRALYRWCTPTALPVSERKERRSSMRACSPAGGVCARAGNCRSVSGPISPANVSEPHRRRGAHHQPSSSSSQLPLDPLPAARSTLSSQDPPPPPPAQLQPRAPRLLVHALRPHTPSADTLPVLLFSGPSRPPHLHPARPCQLLTACSWSACRPPQTPQR